MMRLASRPPDAGAAKAARHRILALGLALVLLAPGVACAYSLGELLRMPLEQLLRLEISKLRTAAEPSLPSRGDHAR